MNALKVLSDTNILKRRSIWSCVSLKAILFDNILGSMTNHPHDSL